MSKKSISSSLLADILSVSKATVKKWEKNGKISPLKNGEYLLEELRHFPQIQKILNSKWNADMKISAIRDYSSVELFAGAGGLAIGLEQAGIKAVALNEIDKDACKTLKHNRQQWNVLEGDISKIDFSKYENIDLVSGGFPCQAFS